MLLTYGLALKLVIWADIDIFLINLNLNHRSSFKGLIRPYVYYTPLTLAPQTEIIISNEGILRRSAEWGARMVKTFEIIYL